jgi:hypothetical protein
VRRTWEGLTLGDLHNIPHPAAEHIAKLVDTCRGGRFSWLHRRPAGGADCRTACGENPKTGRQPFQGLFGVLRDGRGSQRADLVRHVQELLDAFFAERFSIEAQVGHGYVSSTTIASEGGSNARNGEGE